MLLPLLTLGQIRSFNKSKSSQPNKNDFFQPYPFIPNSILEDFLKPRRMKRLSKIFFQKTSNAILEESMIFLPLACSVATLPYFHELEGINLNYDSISVVAMEFGIKNSLFDECLLRDIWLIGSGSLFVLLCMWLYTESLFLTIMTIIAIVFSLGISYFMYTLIFELRFFPFMNLLVIIVAVGKSALIFLLFFPSTYFHTKSFQIVHFEI